MIPGAILSENIYAAIWKLQKQAVYIEAIWQPLFYAQLALIDLKVCALLQEMSAVSA